MDFKLGDLLIPKDIETMRKWLEEENMDYEIRCNSIILKNFDVGEILFLLIAMKNKIQEETCSISVSDTKEGGCDE